MLYRSLQRCFWIINHEAETKDVLSSLSRTTFVHLLKIILNNGQMRKRPKALDPDFGPRLKRAIDDVPGLTVVAFANQINVKEQTVWAWIRGDYEPSSYRWGTIAERLGTPVKELFHVSDSRAENGKDSAASTDGVKEFETNVAENGQGTDELPPKRLERTDMEKKLRAIRDILKQPISDSVKLRLIDALVPESEDATESGFHAGTRTS